MRRSYLIASGVRSPHPSWLRANHWTHPFGIESSLWVALTVSLAMHAAVILLAAWDQPTHRVAFEIALYGGPGDGRGRHGGAGTPGRSGGGAAPAVLPEPANSKPMSSEPVRPSESASRRRPARAGAQSKKPAVRHRQAVSREPAGVVPGTRAAAAPVPGAMKMEKDVLRASRPGAKEDPSGAAPITGVLGSGHGGSGAAVAAGVASGHGAGGGGGGDLHASCLACPVPAYPRQARRHGWQGVVDLRLRLDAAGRVADVGVAQSSGFRVLDDAAIAAARRSRFRLYRRVDDAADRWGRMRYRFEIGDG